MEIQNNLPVTEPKANPTPGGDELNPAKLALLIAIVFSATVLAVSSQRTVGEMLEGTETSNIMTGAAALIALKVSASIGNDWAGKEGEILAAITSILGTASVVYIANQRLFE
jgi:hypothetical protein